MSLCRPMVSTSFWVKPTQADRSSHPPSFLTLNRPPPSFRSIGIKDAYYGTLLREYHNIPFAKGCCTEIGTETVTFRLTNRDRTPDELSTFKILGPGMIILKNYLSLKDQVCVFR
ncbi:uncharacterized protein LOC110880228 [Helianthus annuus]|uniref:uncharacterized protein LOC110880228 n=1 Tax=Helianthus annuus TaxID=4232 RepID=UPI001652D3BC|nr:uncharacterized protein LOC110880228 [Helianthus annuus]